MSNSDDSIISDISLINDDFNNEGYIYVIFNDMFNYHGEDIYKIGKTNDINKRLNGYITTYINKTELIYLSDKVKDYHLCEKLLFQNINENRVVQNREFFKIDKLEATTIIKKVVEEINLMTDDEIKTKNIELQNLVQNLKVIKVRHYNENNKELIKQKRQEYHNRNIDKNKAYRELNKDKLKEAKQTRDKISYFCECGGKYKDSHKQCHNRSKKHINFLF